MAKTKINLRAVQRRLEERREKEAKAIKNKIPIYIPKSLTQAEKDWISYGITRIEHSRKNKPWAKNKAVHNVI